MPGACPAASREFNDYIDDGIESEPIAIKVEVRIEVEEMAAQRGPIDLEPRAVRAKAR